MFMRTDRNLAITLRRQNLSYDQISKQLNIPKSTLSVWFKNNPWSSAIRNNLSKNSRTRQEHKLKLMLSANKSKWDKWHAECQNEAIHEFPTLKKDPLFVTGIMLYWGEGDKALKNNIVRMCNSDPQMIKVYYKFLKNVLKIPTEKIIIRLTLYPDLEEKEYQNLWSKMLGIDLIQFRNSAIIQGRHPTKLLSYGVCSIEVYSRKLKEKIFTWIRLYQQDINNEANHDIIIPVQCGSNSAVECLLAK